MLNGVSSNPVLTAFPYLPLAQPLQVGPWTVAPLSEFKGTWASSRFETSARAFLAAFRTPAGGDLENPAVVARHGALDGCAPTPAERNVLERAVGFAVIDSNPYWADETKYAGHQIATSDNADLWVQPLDTVGHWITLERGSRIRTTIGGHRLTDGGFMIPSPLELNLPMVVRCDDLTADALYRLLTSSPDAHRIRTAVDWLLKSWKNSASISEVDRIVFLKTALEALTGESSTQTAGPALVTLFSDAATQEGEGIGLSGLLWSPSESTRTRTWSSGGKVHTQDVSELEHWYGALADARNEIIHEGANSQRSYSEDGSPYVGPIAEVADRVTREAILVAMGTAGHPEVWRRGLSRASLLAYRELRTQSQGAAPWKSVHRDTEANRH